MRFFLCIIIAACLTGCNQGEIPISPHASGDLETTMIEIGSEYKNQIFYNLESNSVVSQNEKTDWDLGFLTGVDDWHIVINSSKAGGIWRVENLDFEDTPEIEDAVWEFDSPNGNLDSTAIDDYRNLDKFYVVDLGYSSTEEQLGYVKLKIDSVNESGYFIRTADLAHEQESFVFIEKDADLHRVCFSFSENFAVDIEPLSSDWDMLFTQYTNLFYDPFSAYLVTGVLINSQYITVAIDSEKEFNEITYEDIESYSFSSNQDVIGYDWKDFDFDSGFYLIYAEKNYIIKNGLDQYFKIHFIDFYDDLGEKGNPTFEIQQL
ncbi:MAG: HmuY family protein [Flavobacteriales bacterium]